MLLVPWRQHITRGSIVAAGGGCAAVAVVCLRARGGDVADASLSTIVGVKRRRFGVKKRSKFWPVYFIVGVIIVIGISLY